MHPHTRTSSAPAPFRNTVSPSRTPTFRRRFNNQRCRRLLHSSAAKMNSCTNLYGYSNQVNSYAPDKAIGEKQKHYAHCQAGSAAQGWNATLRNGMSIVADQDDRVDQASTAASGILEQNDAGQDGCQCQEEKRKKKVEADGDEWVFFSDEEAYRRVAYSSPAQPAQSHKHQLEYDDPQCHTQNGPSGRDLEDRANARSSEHTAPFKSDEKVARLTQRIGSLVQQVKHQPLTTVPTLSAANSAKSASNQLANFLAGRVDKLAQMCHTERQHKLRCRAIIQMVPPVRRRLSPPYLYAGPIVHVSQGRALSSDNAYFPNDAGVGIVACHLWIEAKISQMMRVSELLPVTFG
ncbi:unnamed protein product [Protopolystoma xenopodis]|uniref:Uncharacterized protein n=1 Tax=Protopolystoma xenopodis TaxID=117903 RepID=A0A448XG62_9PLAT|nr:unnamed protein product [Protopolystoma xenopodis]